MRLHRPEFGIVRGALLFFFFVLSAVLTGLVPGGTALAQANNACDQPGEAPDIIVGDLHQTTRYGAVGNITGYAIGTVSCNIGTCAANWQRSPSNQHPVIGQNMFRLKDGRFEQIGQSWVKHGFTALSQTLCSTACLPTDGRSLGVNCSDPYSATTNGTQTSLGPKFEVDPVAGVHPHPVTNGSNTGNAIYKRLQVNNADLDPSLNAGALYFIEGQYVAQDDAEAKNQLNNASHREVLVSGSAGTYNLSLTGTTQRQRPAIMAWADRDPDVRVTIADVDGDGRFYVAAKVTFVGGGTYRYEYAVQNLTSQRAARQFVVPIPYKGTPQSLGFHDVDYHSGEPFALTDWPTQVNDTTLSWSTDPFGANPNANALRWGTLYNFRFEIAAPPENGEIVLGLFRPGTPVSISVATLVPQRCDSDGLCEPNESCTNCAFDCPTVGPDVDGDSFIVCTDCDDGNAGAWATPGEAQDVRVGPGGALAWLPPAAPGGSATTYDVLRSTNPTSFAAAACLPDPNPSDLGYADGDLPLPGAAFSYLVRATNACPAGAGDGTLGTGSGGSPRSAPTCP